MRICKKKEKIAIDLAKKRIKEIDKQIEKLIREKQIFEPLCQNLSNKDNVITFKDTKNE